MTDAAAMIVGVARKTAGVRPHRDRWIAQLWVADPAHPRGGRNVYRTFATEEEAALWRSQARLEARRSGGLRVRVAGEVPTVTAAGEALLEGIESGAVRKRGGGRYRPGVRRAYKRALALYVYPRFGDWRLSHITQPDLLDLVEGMQAAGLSASTIKNALDPVRVIYRRAVERGVVDTNPTLRLSLPAGEKSRDRVADPTEAAQLVAALERLDDRSLWAVALYCGLRAGELRALRWRHVDLARGRIRVDENLPIDAPRDEAAAETGDPKTKAGRREVPIPPRVHDAVTAWGAEQLVDVDRYVWPAADGGPFARTSVMKRARAAWKAAELDEIGLHEARHSAVSMWIASGLPVKVVSELAGHASIAITLDRYGHLFPAALDGAAAAFAAYLERADTTRRLEQLDEEPPAA
jgi:integrase